MVHCLSLLLALPFASATSLRSTDFFRLSSLGSNNLGLYKLVSSYESQQRQLQEKEQLLIQGAAGESLGWMELESSSQKDEKYGPHFFDQRVSHDPKSEYFNVTFKQRYWLDDTFYEPGGPIILLDGGETSGEDRIPFLDRGILYRLSKELHGLGIVFEHRYYGESFPFPNISTDSLRFLDTLTSIHDNAYFAKTVCLPSRRFRKIDSDPVTHPWIIYGGSYAGGKAAFTRSLYPDVFMGGIASSAVTHATVNYWEYLEPIRLSGPPKCIEMLLNHVKVVDTVLGWGQEGLTTTMKRQFGLENVTSDQDFVSVLQSPMGMWQGGNWEDGPVGRFERFCEMEKRSLVQWETIETLITNLAKQWNAVGPIERVKSFRLYAEWFRKNVAALCEEEDQDKCFGSDNEEDYQDVSLDQGMWRAWHYQVCTEWGYYIVAAPEDQPSLVSRLLDVPYHHKTCAYAYPPGKLNRIPRWPDVKKINQYGDFNYSFPRLAFIDGSADPWVYATPHSPENPAIKTRQSTTSEPFIMIPNARHHYDENGLRDWENEPKEIRKVHEEEVAFVKAWLGEWDNELERKKKWRMGPWRLGKAGAPAMDDV
ncbi:hypothetical protein BT69DRAFT_1237902 [Atractiella rhizophila]|nr:hypothetical protein BT69DRAFT_1237902 [Atractiella rhizophila]